MADIVLDVQASSALSVAAGQGGLFFDSIAELLFSKKSNGRCYGSSHNAATVAQAGFSADTYVTNSDLQVPSFGVQAKTVFHWRIAGSKTGAGTAQPIYVIRLGANRTIADTAILTLTGPLQTAVADIGTLNVLVTMRTVGAAGVIAGAAWWSHRGTAASTTVSGTGFANDVTGHIEGTSAGFDNQATTIAGQHFGLSINGGTLAAWTLTQCYATADW